jgi:hypothetical protein
MTYQGIDFTHASSARFSPWSKNSVRKTVYNLLAVVALMAAAGIIASAYRPVDGQISNPRFESMGIHVPTAFRGAPQAH